MSLRRACPCLAPPARLIRIRIGGAVDRRRDEGVPESRASVCVLMHPHGTTYYVATQYVATRPVGLSVEHQKIRRGQRRSRQDHGTHHVLLLARLAIPPRVPRH